MIQEASLKPDSSEKTCEPASRSPLLFIGRNRRGCWVVRDQSGARGGLFVSREEAHRFALFESDFRPQGIIFSPGYIELDLSGSPKAPANDAPCVPAGRTKKNRAKPLFAQE
jgi:hypothetical protein